MVSKQKRYVTEEQVKRALKVDDWRHLSKKKVLQFTSMIPNMDPEVAKAAIAQFPTYASFATEIVNELKKVCEKVIESADESQKMTIESYQKVLDYLGEMLKKDSITQEEREKYTSYMISVADKIAEVNSEHKAYVKDIFSKALPYIGGALLLGAAILGVNVAAGLGNGDLPEIEDDNDEKSKE